MITWLTLTHEIEREVRAEIDERTQDRWDENSITDNIVKRVRKTLVKEPIDALEATAVAAKVYKARGAVETKFGDLAILIHFGFRDGSSMEGVAFYEAKRRAWDAATLPMAKKPQFLRLNKNLWHAKLLVYDREPIITPILAEMMNEAYERPWRTRFLREPFDDIMPFTKAAAIPVNAVLALGKYDTSLYKLAVPFSYELCLRNLQGLDLEHDTETIAMVKGQSVKYGVPRTVLSIAVRRGPGEGAPPLPHLDDAKLEEVAAG